MIKKTSVYSLSDEVCFLFCCFVLLGRKESDDEREISGRGLGFENKPIAAGAPGSTASSESGCSFLL
jgi:hypothetical protein